MSVGTHMKQIKLYNIGINDIHKFTKNDSLLNIHKKWQLMLSRCYGKTHPHNHTYYKNVTVCTKWLTFSNFKKWMENQDWVDKELDKDILYPNNNVYSPKFCCFVTRQLNQALVYKRTKKYSLPVGVSFDIVRGKYKASISINGKTKFLGRFDVISEASNCYIDSKIKYIKTFYPSVPKKVKKGLKRHVKLLKLNLTL